MLLAPILILFLDLRTFWRMYDKKTNSFTTHDLYRVLKHDDHDFNASARLRAAAVATVGPLVPQKCCFRTKKMRNSSRFAIIAYYFLFFLGALSVVSVFVASSLCLVLHIDIDAT